MQTINIKLTADRIRAAAGEKVEIVAKFDTPAYASVNERRDMYGYQNVMRTRTRVTEIRLCPIVHSDTTDFIVMADTTQVPHLKDRQNAVEAWHHVDVIDDAEPTPDPQPEPTDRGRLMYRVGLMSDIHMDVEDSHNSEYKSDLQNALEVFRQQQVDFICSCGDYAQYNDEDYEQFCDYYNAHAWAPTYGSLRLFTPMGNHDYLRIYHQRNSVPDGYASVEMLWQNNISIFHEPESTIHFFEYGAKWDDTYKTGKRTIKSKTNYWFENMGDIYVMMSVDYGASTGTPWDDVIRGFNLLPYDNKFVAAMTDYVSDTAYNRERESRFDYQFYDPEVLCWLRDIIEANQDKRVFVFSHHFLPHKAGDADGIYSRLRIWPYTDSEAVRQKYYSGSNTLCGLTFWFIDKLNNEHKNVVWFSGHSHRNWLEGVSECHNDYVVRKPTGEETTPLVDDLQTLINTEYDYRLYSRKSSEPVAECGHWIGLPSLSKPIDDGGTTLYQSSQGAIMDVYERGIVISCMSFKAQGASDYENKVIKEIEL